MRPRPGRNGALLGAALALIAGLVTAGAATSGAAAAVGALPLLPDGLNVAIGAKATVVMPPAAGSPSGITKTILSVMKAIRPRLIPIVAGGRTWHDRSGWPHPPRAAGASYPSRADPVCCDHVHS